MLDRGAGRNSSLLTYFRACMFVLYVNFRSFGVAAILSAAFFLVSLVLSGSSTSSMFLFRGNSRTFGVAAILAAAFFLVILVLSGFSISSMFLFGAKFMVVHCLGSLAGIILVVPVPY